MKTKHILLFLTGLLALGCAKDKGNYDYNPINEITIEGIDSDYYCFPGDMLSITVELTNSKETPESAIEYVWEVNGKVISTEKNLTNFLIDDMKFGANLCRFTAADNNTGMKYFKEFNINMTNVFNWGYYFLTRKSDNSTVLSYMQAIPDDKITGNEEFAHITSIEGYELGKDPVAITGLFQLFQAYDDYYFSIDIITREGEFPVIETDNAAFMPSKMINSSLYIDQESGYKFNPEQIIIDTKNRYFFISNGQIVVYNYKLLYRPAVHNNDYYWTYMKDASYYTQLFAFDRNTEKFYALNPSKGVLADDNAWDMATEVTFPGVDNPPSFKGHFILGSKANGAVIDDDYVNVLNVISGDSKGLYNTELTMSYEKETSVENTKEPRTTFSNVTGIDANSKALVVSKYWYVSAGNKIYRSPTTLLDFNEYVTLPSELGVITCMEITAKESALVVTTYNEASGEERKGSVIFIDFATKKIITHKNVIDECVAFFCANTIPWWDAEVGDGK